MSFYTGRDARDYDKKFKFIVDRLVKEKLIKAKNNKKAKSEAFRFIIDRFYEYLKENKNKKEGE